MLAGPETSEDEGEEGSGDDDSGDERPRQKRKLTLEERRQERAAGDHPLQQRFKEISKSLLKKHAGKADEGDSANPVLLDLTPIEIMHLASLETHRLTGSSYRK